VKKDNAANVQLLLDQLSDVRDGDRGAHYTCHIAVVIPETGEEFVIVGNWPGTVAREVHGVNGFGYDPIFIPEGFEVSAAVLDPAEKNRLSHRSRALVSLAERLNS
jgi:XTP/dITP diphosphohydrolase